MGGHLPCTCQSRVQSLASHIIAEAQPGVIPEEVLQDVTPKPIKHFLVSGSHQKCLGITPDGAQGTVCGAKD